MGWDYEKQTWQPIQYLREIMFLGIFKLEIKEKLATGLEIPRKTKQEWLSDVNKYLQPFCSINWKQERH